jgi:hypothetical protein
MCKIKGNIYFWHPKVTRYTPVWIKNNLVRIREETRITVAYSFERDGFVIAGFSTCNPEDQFCKAEGRALALQNYATLPIGFHVNRRGTPTTVRHEILDNFKYLIRANVSLPGIPAKWDIS